MPTLNAQRLDTAEADGSPTAVKFRVWILDPSDEEISFDYTLSPGTIAPGDFFVGTNMGPLVGTIKAGETFVDLSFFIANDNRADEVDEAYWLEVFNPVNADLPDGVRRLSALGGIKEDDSTGSALALFVSSPRVIEFDDGTRAAAFDVHLSRASDSTLTFDYGTRDGSAKAGADYVAKADSLTFNPGELTKTVLIDIVGDTDIELSEFFSLVVTPTSDIKNGALASTGVAHILDDDTTGGTLPTISVERASIGETDASGSGPVMIFKVTLSEPSEDEVTINFAGRHGSTEISDYRGNLFPVGEVLTIEAGQTTAFVKMYVQGDKADEVDEGVWLDLYNPKNAVFAGEEPRISALGIIEDDNGSGSNLALFVSSPTLREGASGERTAVFEIHLSHGYDQDLTFSFLTSDGSAQAGSDYVARTGTVTFLAGQTIASVEVQTLGDGVNENSETFSLLVTPTAEIKNGSASHAGIATIANDDSIHETIEGGDNDDKLSGNDGNDTLHGFGGADKLDGGTGNDSIFGGDAADEIVGGLGRDELHGEGGKDVFIFRTAAESGAKSSRRDTIQDFSAQEGDVLNLKGIDANAGKGGNQAFKFIGTDAFSGRPGELRYDRDGSDVILYGNTDNDRKYEFSLVLDGISSIGAADIIL